MLKQNLKLNPENKENNAVYLLHEKNPFFYDAAHKTRTTCKTSTFFEDLNFQNPRSHLKSLSDNE